MGTPYWLNVDYIGAEVPVPTTNPLEPADPGTWTTIKFNRVIANNTPGLFESPYTLLRGGTGKGMLVSADISLLLKDFPGTNGSQCQIRKYELDASGRRVETGKHHEFQTQSEHSDPNRRETTHFTWHFNAFVNPGHQLRVEMTQFHDSDGWPDGFIKEAQAELIIWPRS